MSEPMPEWGEAVPAPCTVNLLFQQFNKVLIPLDEVHTAYFRNRSASRFRRALQERTIPLPVITLDNSQKGIAYVCIFQLAAFIELRAIEAARARNHQRMIDAVPITQFRDAAIAAPKTQA